ncbi:hypothetical protein D4A92_00175 [Rhizobium rosettiformans]|uniref:DUF4175 domain-containing protein n=1 Tax=Rhizobium rosettiformans TaxID=1368430 RepID=A0ABX7ES32_9HYPH|nr:hypothetical protein [Rhizobium rosettiformans]QRF49971.1 hypothetical protein D4A92_00175 [Rhizobium rosettiformans]
MKSLLKLWRRQPVLTSAFLLAMALAIFFAGRTIFFVAYWSDPARQDLPPEPWMTIGYVAHSWHVPVEKLARDLDLPPPPKDGPRPSLERLASERGQSFETFKTEIEASLAELRRQGPAQ